MKQIHLIHILFVLLLLPSHARAEEAHEHEHEHGHEHEEKESAVHIPASVLKEKGIETGIVGPVDLTSRIRVNGRISANQDKLAHIHPRFSGIVKEVHKQQGDQVEKGELLAVIESNQSLQRYEVISLISGTAIFRHATVGEFVTESDPIFIVADLRQLWVDLFIFPRDFSSIRLGQKVLVRPPYTKEPLSSSLSFVSQLVDEATQARIARVVVENKNGNLYPDAYVDAEIFLGTTASQLAVKASAIQTIGEKSIVFISTKDRFEPREVLVGDSDGIHTSVLSGITAGERYAFGETYLLKAELGKSTAAHEH